jgi:ABC-type Na+ efflux pump permease subunit
MPVSRSLLLTGKILARFCLGLLQFLVVFMVGAALKMNFGKDPLALLLLVIVSCLAITALAFAVGSGMKNAIQASMLSLSLQNLDPTTPWAVRQSTLRRVRPRVKDKICASNAFIWF